MKDLEQLIKQSLEGAGQAYSPSDEIAARERFIRLRRRRRGYWFAGSATATAMAVAVALFVVPSRTGTPDQPIQVAARPLQVVQTIEVGGSPSSLVSDGDSVWVSNAEGHGVVRIDPKTNEVEAVLGREGQTPDELAASGRDLWVTTEQGTVTRLNGRTGEILGDMSAVDRLKIETDRAATHLDVAAGEEELWAVSGADDRFFRARETDGFEVDLFDFGMGFSDVAYDGRVWLLGEDDNIYSLIEPSPEGVGGSVELLGDAGLEGVGGGNSDLAAGLGYVWASSGDDSDLRIFRADPSGNEDVLEIPLEGRYADLTVADGRLWVLTGGGEESLLYRIAPDGAIEGEPLFLPATVNDIAVGAGAAWVADTASGNVLRIEEGAEDPAPAETEEPVGSAQPFFAYSADGDIYLELTDGTNRQVTMSPDEELNPTFVFGDALVFERHDHETDWFGLVRHDLATGEESSVPLPDGWEGGAHPAVSAAGDLAVALTREEGETIVVWPGYFTEERAEGALEVPLPEELSDVRGLIFSDDAKVLYYQAIGEGWVTVQLPWKEGAPPTPFVLNGVNDQPRGTTYVQPDDATEDNVTVLDVCCRETDGDPYSQFSIARIYFTEGGATHKGLSGPADLAGAEPGSLSMVSLHGAVAQEDGSWDLFADEQGSWLVTDGSQVWLLTTEGGGGLAPDTLAGGELSGFSVNPTLEGY